MLGTECAAGRCHGHQADAPAISSNHNILMATGWLPQTETNPQTIGHTGQVNHEQRAVGLFSGQGIAPTDPHAHNAAGGKTSGGHPLNGRLTTWHPMLGSGTESVCPVSRRKTFRATHGSIDGAWGEADQWDRDECWFRLDTPRDRFFMPGAEGTGLWSAAKPRLAGGKAVITGWLPGRWGRLVCCRTTLWRKETGPYTSGEARQHVGHAPLDGLLAQVRDDHLVAGPLVHLQPGRGRGEKRALLAQERPKFT